MDVAERGGNVYVKVDQEDENEQPAIEMTATNAHASRQFYEQDSEDDVQEKGTCVDNCYCLACLFMVGSVVIGSLSVVFDWLWVADMFRAEKALVFGPPNTGVYVTLIITACCGTVTFICENGDKIYKFFKRKEIFDEQAEETLSLFLEEVPQMTLNLMLSMCREVPTSYFQLLKAGLGMASTGLRLVKALCQMLGCRTPKPDWRKLRRIGRILLVGACAYTFSAGIAVFVFMFREPDSADLGGGFYAPANVFGEAYNTERYFPNSAVFFTHPTLDHCSDDSLPSTNARSPNWIRIEVTYTFLTLKAQSLNSTYSYNDTTAMFSVASKRRKHCFVVALELCNIVLVDGDSCDYSLPHNATSLDLVFHHVPKTSTLVFGDIVYNGTISTRGQCDYLKGDNYGAMYHDTKYSGRLHYFKAPFTVNTTLPIRYDNNTNTYGFYKYPDHLVNVTEAWKTGYKDCEMSGAMAPNSREAVILSCKQTADYSNPGGGYSL